MIKAGAERVTVLDDPTSWSNGCISYLRQQKLNAVLQPPFVDLLVRDEVEGGLFIVPVPFLDSPRFELVRRVGELGGSSLVLAGRDAGSMAILCMTYVRAACLPKSYEFAQLTGAIRDVLSPNDRGRDRLT